MMPILAIPGEIEVELTHECNWNCPYCAIRTHEQQNITIEQMFSKIQSIPSNSVVTLSGGEPGLIDKKYIKQIIEMLKTKHCILNLNTNGMFLEKYPELVSNFKEVVYHCSQNLDANDKIIRQKFDSCIRYMIIVNDENYHKLDQFLNVNDDIIFDIVQATYNDANGVKLSSINKNKLIVKYASRMTKESFHRLFKEKDWDSMRFI